jgi:hypothetical protein
MENTLNIRFIVAMADQDVLCLPEGKLPWLDGEFCRQHGLDPYDSAGLVGQGTFAIMNPRSLILDLTRVRLPMV